MRSFRHHRVNGVSDDTAPTDSTENGNGSNNNENNEIAPIEQGSQRRKRGRTQPKMPPPGQQIPIKPLGEELVYLLLVENLLVKIIPVLSSKKLVVKIYYVLLHLSTMM
jgi:hypothetical protein